MQIPAETIELIFLAKGTATKTTIINFRFRNCHQRHQTSNANNRGGGAHAARRIRIRRPRLEGQSVHNKTPTFVESKF